MTGGGILGSVTAYYLTRHLLYDPKKHDVVILEASRIASAASGKAGGLLASWAYPSTIAPLSFQLHQKLAQEHGGARLWGFRHVMCGHISLSERKQQPATTNNVRRSISWTSLPSIWLGKLRDRAMSLRRAPVETAAELTP